MNSTKILIVDDDQRICRLVKRYLENNDYEMVETHTAENVQNIIENDSISLILLDIMLPDKDGLSLARDIRDTSSTPIIFLTARAEIENKVTGLEIGADDYITKPFEEKELIARILAVLRRTQSAVVLNRNKTRAYFAGWCLNLLDQTLVSPECKRVDITSTEYRLLLKPVKQSNNTIKREEILHILSNREWTPLDRSADMAISKLRKKIERNPRKPEIIKTIRNKGYQLTAEVDFMDS